MTPTTTPPAPKPAAVGPHWWSRLLRVAGRNVFWNYCGTATGMVVGFVVTPVLVRRLGDTNYGTWILLGSIAGYFNLMDLGLRGSVGRMIALHKARGEADEVRRMFTSSLAVLTGVGALALLGVMGMRVAFFALFDVAAEDIGQVQTALLIVGVNLALSFPLKVFDGTLWAHERFDLINWVDIPVHVVRAALTLVFIEGGRGLVTLAWITLAMTVVAALAKAVFCWRENPALRVAPQYVSAAAIRALYHFGIWGFLMQGARQTRIQAAPIIIGSSLGVPFVTPFALARRLLDYAQTAIVTGTGVFTPVATKLHAVEDADTQRALFLTGGKVCTAIAFCFLGLFFCFGGSFLRLWIGPSIEHAGAYLVILALGETLALSQSITGNMVLSKARHARLAAFAIYETALSIPAAFVLAGLWGVTGVCLGIVLPQIAFSGIATIWHGCRVMSVPVRDYVRHVMTPVVARGAVPIALIWLAVNRFPPPGWAALVGWAAAFGLAYAGAVAPAIVEYSRVADLIMPRLGRFGRS